MSNVQKLIKEQNTKILVPANSYEFSKDTRLLIPFTNGDKIGFTNNEGEVVVKPQFAMYYGECYSESDFIRVVIHETYGYPRSGGKVSTYQRPLLGLINYKGDLVLNTEYYVMIPSIGNKTLFTVQNKDRKYGVINADGDIIIPFGTYNWIDGFDKGLARVKMGKESSNLANTTNKWGIVDENGDIVLPVEYSNIWNFYGKSQYSDLIVTNDEGNNVILKDFLISKGKKDELNDTESNVSFCSVSNYRNEHYEEFAGTYAQDIAGYSDEDIYDVFEGDPDAYWNID